MKRASLPSPTTYIFKVLKLIRDLEYENRTSSYLQKMLRKDAPYMSESISSGACSRLLELGLVTAKLTRNKYNRPRRNYTITESGLAHLQSVENGTPTIDSTQTTLRPDSVILKVLQILNELMPNGDIGSSEIGVKLFGVMPGTNATGVTTALRQLQDKGFVEVLKMQTRHGRKARRLYGVTLVGLQELEKHLRTTVDKAA